jgi:hypothetical protein
MEGASTGFSSLPPAAQLQLGVLGPLLFGLVCGFLLGETEVGWWVSQALAAAGGVAGGLEHPNPRQGALRGLVAGVSFGLGIVAGDAISGDPPQAEAPEPIGLIVIVTATIGTLFGALGARLAARPAA